MADQEIETYWKVRLFQRRGDKLARIAQPIARAIDNITGANIANCGGCKKMRDRLNDGMPVTEAMKLRLEGK